MKKVQLTSFGVIAALGLLASCDEGMDLGDMTGTILPDVKYDATVKGAPSARSNVSEFDQIKVEDLTLTLTSADGKHSEEFSAGNFPSDRGFAVGKYTLTASYGDADDEGFEKPAVYGETQLTVSEGKATRVELTAVPSKAMVGIVYDEAALNYFTELKASLHSVGGQTIEYSTSESRFAYLKPGEVTLDVTFTKPNGKGGTLEVAKFDAEAQHRYTLGIKLGGDGAGEVSGLTVTFDETLTREDITVDISDELLSVPAPEVELSGVQPGETINQVSGSPLTTPVRVDIKARGGIKSAVLTTRGNDINLPEGWPTEIDLAAANASQQTLLESFGFKNIGIFNNPGHLAAFELTEVINSLPSTAAGIAPITFELKVTDKNGKVASEEPLAFSVKVDDLSLTMEGIEGAAYDGAGSVDVLVKYNGTADLTGLLQVKYLATSGQFKSTAISNVAAKEGQEGAYVVTIAVPADAQIPVVIVGNVGALTTDEVTVPAAPAPVVAVADNDVFAKQLYASISTEGYSLDGKEVTAEVATFNSATNSYANFSKATASLSGTDLHVSGLTPSTKHKIRVKVGALISNEVEITTEAAAQIPGADMESWTPQNFYGHLGAWTVSRDYNNPNEPWFGSNGTSFSKATYQSYRSCIDAVGMSDGHISGSTAAFVRTVGVETKTISKTPSSVWAGELTLGEDNTGYSLQSRPSAITFWYTYSDYDNQGDKGLAEITVTCNDVTVCEFSKQLDPTATFTKVTTPDFNYAGSNGKSIKVNIKFRSTATDNFLTSNNVNGLSSGGLGSGSASDAFLGSTLVVDDVELVY
ncbi:MAG: DUF4493 domain-containing protein [Bacteroides sp.]|nr:DUF4493 domain-containing protein [Bacteroides sp.]MCM1379716.1 DUF4493 domain-containing protein [Bacteroides sp.]MCM1446071.1 DUF4493 domain-containing protein [Prevotella sp.]